MSMADATSKAELSEPCPATFLTSTPNWDDGAGHNERRLASTPRESVHGLVHPAPSRRGLQTAQGSRSTDARQALPDVQPKGSRTPRGTSTRLSELPLVTPNQLRDRARHLSERRNRAQAGSLDTPDYSLPSSIRMGTSAIQKHLRGQLASDLSGSADAESTRLEKENEALRKAHDALRVEFSNKEKALARLDSEFRQLCKETRHCEGEISEKHRDEEEGGEAEWMAALLGISNAKRTNCKTSSNDNELEAVQKRKKLADKVRSVTDQHGKLAHANKILEHIRSRTASDKDELKARIDQMYDLVARSADEKKELEDLGGAASRTLRETKKQLHELQSALSARRATYEGALRKKKRLIEEAAEREERAKERALREMNTRLQARGELSQAEEASLRQEMARRTSDLFLEEIEKREASSRVEAAVKHFQRLKLALHDPTFIKTPEDLVSSALGMGDRNRELEGQAAAIRERSEALEAERKAHKQELQSLAYVGVSSPQFNDLEAQIEEKIDLAQRKCDEKRDVSAKAKLLLQDSKLAIDHLVSMVQSLFGSSFRVGAAADLPQCLSQVERLLLDCSGAPPFEPRLPTTSPSCSRATPSEVDEAEVSFGTPTSSVPSRTVSFNTKAAEPGFAESSLGAGASIVLAVLSLEPGVPTAAKETTATAATVTATAPATATATAATTATAPAMARALATATAPATATASLPRSQARANNIRISAIDESSKQLLTPQSDDSCDGGESAADDDGDSLRLTRRKGAAGTRSVARSREVLQDEGEITPGRLGRKCTFGDVMRAQQAAKTGVAGLKQQESALEATMLSPPALV
uniref:Uncharacterized protein n=1 Tax=Chrysotila carterae TaxID=13221 RepID=A0A7S4B524_CHRCT